MSEHNTAPRIEWTIDDSSFSSYVDLVRFKRGSARELIERRIGKAETNSALDIAGGTHGRAILDLIEQGYIGQGAYTNLVDARQYPGTANVHLITGDLLDISTWHNIKAVQEDICPAGFDLVLHRPYGGLQDLSLDHYLQMACATLDMTRSGGVLYSQVPATYAYSPKRPALANNLYRRLVQSCSIESIDVTDPANNLADHDFCLIYKR